MSPPAVTRIVMLRTVAGMPEAELRAKFVRVYMREINVSALFAFATEKA